MKVRVQGTVFSAGEKNGKRYILIYQEREGRVFPEVLKIYLDGYNGKFEKDQKVDLEIDVRAFSDQRGKAFLCGFYRGK